MGTRTTLGDLSDAELVDRTKQGDGTAFAELYRRHAGACRAAVAKTTFDRERQRDQVQEAFTRALAKLPTLREPELFRPWLLRIARNTGIDELRTRTNRGTELLGDDDELVVDGTPEPSDAAEARALAGAINDGIALLSPRDAAALSMVVHLGFGPAEVAAALDITVGNAKVVVHRARRRLREALVQQQLLDRAGAE